MNEFENLHVEFSEGVAVATFNRPEVMNALNQRTLEELDALLQKLEGDDGVGILILTGAGGKAFVAGADIREFSRLDALSARGLALRGQRLFTRLEEFSRPVVAAVNGFCLGGGCELALACHIRIASENAKFGQPEVKLGIIPGYGGTQRLTRLVGKGKALELILTGEMIAASEAKEIGLVNHVVAAENLLPFCRELAGKMLKNGPLALRYAIQAVNGGAEMSLHQGLDYEATLFGLSAASEDMKEGTRAFLEKRKPEFQGK
ncbi:MAG TPA: enoyl-CoA hydratase-related protein [Acidobacteriota bacterium]|nr:enoyl-CoA hydratase-related protein [Acidobacteriota bacterium]